jgi:Arc/MetJ-type ribon-helix-helix transcriptional regulator
MISVQVRVTKKLMEKIDDLVNSGFYSTRSEAIRDAIRRIYILQAYNQQNPLPGHNENLPKPEMKPQTGL